MKVMRVKQPGGLDNLVASEADKPEPGVGEILVRARASSLNFHDYAVAAGMIPVPDGRIPLSDVAGEVVETGTGVSEFAVGDKVIGCFFPRWQAGKPRLSFTWQQVPGDTIEGYASEFVCAAETAFTRIPKGYSLEEAATLPCAAVTAWRALFTEGQLQAGETVLVLGTGGVSIFALQLAKAAGARVIATSSSDEKLERLRQMGADHLINYKKTPEWGKAVAELCPDGGADVVVEVGGPGTLAQSIDACREDGLIALIGVLTGMAGEVPTMNLMVRQQTLKGITVGTRADQQALVKALEHNGIKPVIDSSFALEDLADAFRHQESQRHFGKISVTYP